MALVNKGSITVNGVKANVTEWSIDGGPDSEGHYDTSKEFVGYTETPGVFSIKLSGYQETGSPRIDWDKLGEGFTFIRDFENGARHQFTGTKVSNSAVESASASEYTFEVTVKAAGRIAQ
ncbi:MAG: hypothetical protein ACRDBH_01435 [Bosea sp. (in: a-proteobacteria)]